MAGKKLVILLILLSSFISHADESEETEGSIFDFFGEAKITPGEEEVRNANIQAEEEKEGGQIQSNAQSEPTGSDEVTETAVHSVEAESVVIPQGDSLTESEASQTVEDNSIRVVNSDAELDIDSSEKTAENGLGEVIRDMSELNEGLKQENEKYREENAILEKELSNAMSKLESYRIDEEMEIEQMSKELEILDSYNKQLKHSAKDAHQQKAKMSESLKQVQKDGYYKEYQEDEEDEEDDDDDDEPALEASDAMIYIIGIGFLFLFLHTCRMTLGYNIDSHLTPTLYNLFVDVTILALLTTLTALVDYSDVLDEDKIDFTMIMVGLAVFILCWFFLGIWLIVAAQSFSRKWVQQESYCHPSTKGLKHAYEIEYADYMVSRKKTSSFKVARNNLQYAVMRQLFICPVFVPPMTENYLRSDFDLSEYLSRSLAEVVSNAFKLSWLGYIMIIMAIITWRLIIFTDEMIQIILLWVIPLVITFICGLLIKHLLDVYYFLVPYVDDVHEINLPEENYGRDPSMNINAVPKPAYLHGHIKSLGDENNYIRCLFWRTHPLKLTCAHIFAGRFPNRHELLFWFDFFGPKFIMGLLQGLCVILTCWITVIIFYYIPMLYEEMDWIGVVLVVLACMFWMFIAGFLVPETFRSLCLTTKIELMKDRAIIEQVVLKTKNERALKSVKLYRQFKMLYRNMKGPSADSAQYMSEMFKFLDEVFLLVADPETRKIHISQLDELLLLCGMNLYEDELRLLAKECEPVSYK
jgi:hypothetical protein